MDYSFLNYMPLKKLSVSYMDFHQWLSTTVCRAFACSFVRSFLRILFPFILFLPNYNGCSCTHGEADHILFFFSWHHLKEFLEVVNIRKSRSTCNCESHVQSCSQACILLPQEWLICILLAFDKRKNFQERASFWGRNNGKWCFENLEFTKITVIWPWRSFFKPKKT